MTAVSSGQPSAEQPRPTPTASSASAAERFQRRLRQHGLQIGIAGVAIVMWLTFILAAPDVFLGSTIYTAFATTTPLFAIVALALTFVVICGEIDLSFVGVMALSMVAFVRTYEYTASVSLAVLACLAAGAACGFLNGALVAGLGIPSLVITLGTQFLFRGLELVLMNAQGVTLTDPDFDDLHSALNGKIFGVPAELLWTIAIAALLWIVLNRTRFGAHLFLAGDNPTSARLMGVKVGRIKTASFVIIGMLAALTGLISAMQVSYFWPTLGDGSLLSPIAAVFLGGTSIFGGAGSIVGTFIGAFIIGAINAGIVSAGVNGFWTQLFFGLVIVASVVLQTLISRRARR